MTRVEIMNKRITAVLTVWVALAVGTGLLAGCSDQSGRELLGYVPANTAFYAGTTDPELAEQSRQINAAQMEQFAKLTGGLVDELDPKAATDQSGAAAGMVVGLYKKVLETANGDKSQTSEFGVQSDGAVAAYTVGALPVLRLVLDDNAQFWKRVTAIEELAGINTATQSREGTELRRYAFDTDDQDKRLDLVVATRGRFAVITLAGNGISDEALALALGEDRPEKSLTDTDKLSGLIDKHGFMDGSLAFMDHQKLVAALTGSSENRLARMTDRLLETWTEQGTEPLKGLRNEACAADMTAIAKQWPYTAAGVTNLTTETNRVDSRLVLATTNTDIAKSLQGLRGHIPQPTEGRPLVGVGVGLDTNEFAATVQDLAKRFTGAELGCPALQTMQARIKNESLNGLTMAERMIGDVRGIGVALRDLTSTGASPMAMKLDAIAEIATPEPDSLWQFIQSTAGRRPKLPSSVASR
jgi:hypothetical protein